MKRLWMFIVVLAFLTPAGILLPEVFKAGAAWGEWGAEEIEGLTGYVPVGLARLSGIWKSPLPDYAFPGSEGKSFPWLGFAYIVSALLGILVTAGMMVMLGRVLSGKNENRKVS